MEKCSGRKGSESECRENKRHAVIIWERNSVSKVDTYGVCGEWFGCNSVQCVKCQRWVHHGCSDVPRQVSLPSCHDIFVEHVLVIIVQQRS